MDKRASTDGYLWIGDQPWRFSRLESVAPDVLFDVDVRLNWGRESAIIYTQAALLHSLAPVVSAAEMEQLSEHEAALVLEHVLSPELNAIEKTHFGEVVIQRVFFDPPTSFLQLPARARNETTTCYAQISNSATSAVMAICLQGPGSVERFQTFLMSAMRAEPGAARSPDEAQSPDDRDSRTPGPPRVAIGPAQLDSKDLQDVEPGDMIELNLPSADAMDAVLIDESGRMTRAIMRSGVLTVQADGSGGAIDQAPGVYFEFAHAYPMPEAQTLRAAPFDNGLVNVLDKGRVRLRGRFMMEQNRLAFVVDLIEPQS